MTGALEVMTVERNAAIVDSNPFSKATFASWIQFCDVKPATQRTYDKAVCNFANFLSINNISEPTRDDVISYRKWLTDEDNDGENAVYKVSTSRLYMTICKKFFRWLSSKGLYLNIADGVKLPAMPQDEHARDSLTLEEARATLSSFTGKTEKELRDHAIMSLMIGCGLRSCEVVRLNIGDMEKRRGIWFLKIHGKKRAGKVDSVQISEELKKTLDDYLAVRPEGKKNTAMFISTSRRNCGQRLQTQTISRLAKKVFAGIGIESDRVTCHSCRATFCTLSLQAGVAMREVSKAMRHTDVKTTEIYANDLNRFNNTTFSTVSNLLFAA